MFCNRPKITAVVSLQCTENPGSQRRWTLVCPAMTSAGVGVDGDGTVNAASDGLLIVRYLLGFRGTALSAAADPGAPRTDPLDLEAYLGALIP